MIDNFRHYVVLPPPGYNDDITCCSAEGHNNNIGDTMLSMFINPLLPYSECGYLLQQSEEKRGYKVMDDILPDDNPLYLDLEVVYDENLNKNIQILWWWTPSGHVTAANGQELDIMNVIEALSTMPLDKISFANWYLGSGEINFIGDTEYSVPIDFTSADCEDIEKLTIENMPITIGDVTLGGLEITPIVLNSNSNYVMNDIIINDQDNGEFTINLGTEIVVQNYYNPTEINISNITTPNFSLTGSYDGNISITNITVTDTLASCFEDVVLNNIEGLNTWDVSAVVSLENLFYNATLRHPVNITRWNLSNVLDFTNAFNASNSLSDTIVATDIDDWESYFGNKIDDMTFTNMFRADEISYPNWHGTFSNGTFIPDKTPISNLVAEVTQNNPIDTNATEADIKNACTFVITGDDYWSVNRIINIADCSISPSAPYSVGEQTLTLTYGSLTTTFTVTITNTSNYLYNWDFTNSLVDAGGADALFHTDLSTAATTTTPATGQFVQGTGLIMRQKSALDIPVNILSPSTSYTVEIDFSNFNLALTSWCYGFVASIPVDSYERFYSGLPDDADGLMVCVDGTEGSYNSYMSNISSQTYFANSTLKIVNRKAANENVVLDFYKDDTLLFSTPDHGSDPSAPFFWDDSVGVSKYVISGHDDELDATVTGMRIYENT